MSAPLLEIEGLATHFVDEETTVRAVDGLDLKVSRGEVVGLVGESGCGKTAAALSILKLLPKPEGRIVGGRVVFDGQDLVDADEPTLERVRGNRIAMVFQDSLTSLNPYLRIESQLVEVARLHLGLSASEARERATALLGRVGIGDPAERMRAYPHELSGGLRQRAMIAMALLCDPELLIADEPTTALDVTVQAQILALLRELRDERGMAVLLISHDLGVVAGLCDRVAVMYAGQIVEEAGTRALFGSPAHPYTQALLESVPRATALRPPRLQGIAGQPPRLDQRFDACRFEPRCGRAAEACRAGEPSLAVGADGRSVRCVRPLDGG